MSKQQSMGTCLLCRKSFSKGTMSTHLKKCRKDHSRSGKKLQETDAIHLIVEGADDPDYWMHLEAAADATLEDLDDLLRQTWLECCGHGSAFRIDDTYYSQMPLDNDDKDLDTPLGAIARSKLKFNYEYDFGDTTPLSLRFVSQRETRMQPHSIEIQARNEAPDIPCDECDKPATRVCPECRWDESGWLCKSCSEEHDCGSEISLPVVNSPRVGVCAYIGNQITVD